MPGYPVEYMLCAPSDFFQHIGTHVQKEKSAPKKTLTNPTNFALFPK